MKANDIPKILDRGNWGDKVAWELYASTKLPPSELCTAVFCLAINPNGTIIMARVARGWSLIGGHVEDGETVEQTLFRESLEEGGFIPSIPRQFAYRKIISTEPIPHQNPAKMYPYPVSYNIFYWATTESQLVTPTGVEVLESGAFTLDKALQLHPDAASIIKYGYNEFLSR